MAPIQYTASMENNNSASLIDSANCESSMSKKTSSSSVQSSQCHQSFTKTSAQMSKSEKTSHVSDVKSGSEIKLPSLNNNTPTAHSTINDVNEAYSNQNIPMAIQTRGNFFEDSFFADVRDNFQKAVGEVLEKCGESSFMCDNMTSYRKLRQLDLKEENQAGTISYGEKENKIVLDVHDFKRDDIKVKVLENNTIQITGHVEKKSGNSVSTQSFHRQFTLPGPVDMTMVTSSMSSDGILTIIIPKLENKQISNAQHATGIDSELSRNKEINQYNSKYNNATESCIQTNSDTSKSSVMSKASNIKSTVAAQSSSIGYYADTCSKNKCSKGENIKQPAQMTITKRGNFFEDTFFADVHHNFQKAVSQVLEKCGGKSSLCDDMTSYRNLRQRDLKEENQAATVSYGDKEHKIVLDVNDFKEGDIKVKVIDNNTIQITGTIEKKNVNAISSQSFHRQFTLPGLPDTVDMALATSSISSDGILTIIIPRIAAKQIISNNEDYDICKESHMNKELNEYSHENTISLDKSIKTEDARPSGISHASNIESGIGEDETISNNNTADIFSDDKKSNSSRERNEYIKENKSMTNKSVKTMDTRSSEPSLISQKANAKSGMETKLSSSKCNTKDVCSEDKDTKGTSTGQPKSMTIRKRGNFFEDSFFADVHEKFQKAVSEVLENYGETSSVADDMTSYRYLRQHNLKEENQAATVSYGEKEHKVVLDVNEFKEGDIKVNIIGDNTVQITGHIEKKNENAISTQSFHQQFTLPGTLDMTLVTSSMSSDGILTVIIPKLATKQLISNIKKDDICNDSYINKEENKYSHENIMTTGKSMKAEETMSSTSSQAINIGSGSGTNLCSNSKTADVFSGKNDSNFNEVRDECSNENTATTVKSMKTMKTKDSKSTLISCESNSKSENETNVSSLNNITTDVCSNDKSRQEESNSQAKSMTIKNKGNFFEDSYFADVRKNFQKAVSEILDKFGETSSVGEDMPSYRNLRQRDLKEENQASTVSYGEKEHKIILDVNDFKNGDIKINIIDYNTVQITGSFEKKNGNITSTQSFHRQFTLPGLPGTVDMALATSSMSSDGILTIIIPRIAAKQIISNTKEDDISKESHMGKELNESSPDNTISLGKYMKSMKAEDTRSSKILHASNMESEISKNVLLSNSNTADVFSYDKKSNLDRETNECSKENATMIGKTDKTMKTVASESSSISQKINNKSGFETNLPSPKCNTTDVCSENKDTKGTSTGQPKSMTIRKRGNFFEDAFFADVHENFQKAVSEVVEKYGKTSSVSDDMTSYRSLRQHDLKDENQAATVSYGEKEHKIVIDVNDFKEGDIKVKIVEDNTIQITGHIEMKNENSISTQSFHQQFTLPGTLDMTLVTSSMSSDGILTVIIPKLVNKQMILNIKKQNNCCKESNANKETNQRSNDSTRVTGNSMKTMKEGSKSSVVSHAKQTTKQHIQQSSSYNCSQNSSSSSQSIQTTSHANRISNNTEISDLYSPVNLSIKRRGQFFQDSFFKDSQKQFDEAMKSILHKFENTNQAIDTEQRYRNLRQKELKEEQQACSMIQDSQKHKIVIDVKEFMEGNLNVKVAGETKILVEGENKQLKGSSVTSQRFNRSFMLPNKIDPSSIQSSLSSDGILTITVPKIKDSAGNIKY